MIYSTVVAALIVATVTAKVFPVDPAHQKNLWENFKRDHGKKFETMEEEMQRFSNFLENLKQADRRNELELRNGGSATHGITRLSDLSQAEFESKFLTADASLKTPTESVLRVSRPVDTAAGLVSWEGVYTTPVKNQGYCGSCWAFSATEQIESDSMRTLGTSYILSPEQITQCANVAQGCGGGWTEVAYKYVTNAGGIVTEANYPYTSYLGVTGTCAVNVGQAVIGVKGYTTISGESQMASYVQSTGPLSVCLDANSWNSYTGGIMSVCGKSVDHCVQAIGVDASSGGYWLVRNSWGSDWGESGNIRLAYGQNTCAITNDPTFVDTFRI
jgi:C1A family cysteine protease